MKSRTHRRDIDGLRAIAVLSVFLYHLDQDAFTGGFVGVDIFFVISGYLISGIILRELAAGTFSIGDFYERRVRRIFPALAVTIFGTLIAAEAIFELHELRPTIDALNYLAFFTTNIYFANQGGYFDAPMAANPFLQTWSLSVEEQFYLFIPLAFSGVHKYARRHLSTILIVAALLSLSLGAYRLATYPEKAFFLTQVRCVELLIGSLLAAGSLPVLRSFAFQQIAAIFGAVLIIGSIWLTDTSWPFPGPGALPVCIGTALVIWAGEGPRTTVVQAVLSTAPLVAIGLISYSLYLIHWPMIVFAKRLLLVELSGLHKVAIAVCAISLSFLSWRFVETPFRQRKVFASQSWLFGAAAALTVMLVTYCVTARRFSSDEVKSASASAPAEAQFPCLIEHLDEFAKLETQSCITAERGQTIAAWGDSYAAHYFKSLRGIAAHSGAGLALFAFGSCPPAKGLQIRERPTCQKFNEIILKKIVAMKPRVVVLSAHWLNYEKRHTLFGNDIFEALTASIETLHGAQIQVLVVGPSPIFPIDVPLIARSMPSSANADVYFARKSNSFDTFFQNLSEKGLITYIPAYLPFCNNRMLCRFRSKDEIFFRDTGHMTLAGAEQVLARIEPELKRLIGD